MINRIQILFASGLRAAANATDKPWIQLAPFGRFPTGDKQYVQVLNAAQSDEIVSWFNGVFAKLKRVLGLNCVPVWLGHPDFAPQQWPERRQLGSVIALRTAANGLEAQIEWNADGVATINAGKDIYPSAAWDCDPVAGGNEIMPSLLYSVGMWRTPVIKDVAPVLTANAQTETPPANPEPTPTPTPENVMNILAKLISMLASLGFLKPDQTTEDDAATGLDAMQTEFNAMKGKLADATTAKTKAEGDKATAEGALTACNAKLLTAEASVTTLTAERDKAKQLLVANAVNHAIETGRISLADKDATVTALNADFDGAHEKLMKAKPALPTAKPLQIGGARETVADEKAARLVINAWTDAKVKGGTPYLEAFNASKDEPKLKDAWEVLTRGDKKAA